MLSIRLTKQRSVSLYMTAFISILVSGLWYSISQVLWHHRNTIPVASQSPTAFVEYAIQKYDIVVFSKTYCPYCKKAKGLLESLNAPHEVFELNTMEKGQEIQAYLSAKTGQYTVPSIFIKQKHIGGSSDLQAAADSGQLQRWLEGIRK